MNLYRKFVRWLAREEIAELERECLETEQRCHRQIALMGEACRDQVYKTERIFQERANDAYLAAQDWKDRHDHLLNQIVNTTKLAETIPPLLLPPEAGNAD